MSSANAADPRNGTGNGIGSEGADGDDDKSDVDSREEREEELHSDLSVFSDLEMTLNDSPKEGYSILMIKPNTTSQRLLSLKQTLRDNGVRVSKEKVDTLHFRELERTLKVEYDNPAVIGQFASSYAGKPVTIWLLSLQSQSPYGHSSHSHNDGEDIFSVLTTLSMNSGMLDNVFFVTSSASHFRQIADDFFLDFGGDTPPETPFIGLKLK